MAYLGAVAVKTGPVTTTITTVDTTAGAASLPLLRVNGTLVSLSSLPLTLDVSGVGVATLHVNAGTSPVVALFSFQFAGGHGISFEVVYSQGCVDDATSCRGFRLCGSVWVQEVNCLWASHVCLMILVEVWFIVSTFGLCLPFPPPG